MVGQWIAANWGLQVVKRLAFYGVLVAAVGVGLVDLLRNFETEPPLMPPPTYGCPIELSVPLVELLKMDRRARRIPDTWTVVASAIEQNEPEIRVARSTVSPPPGRDGSCELKVRKAPEAPGSPVDWRIGHVVGGINALVGRTVTFNVKLKATQQTAFDSASIYIHDGVGVSATAFDLVSTDWKDVSVQRVVDSRASVLEVWIRLIFDKGTIRPIGGSLYVSSRVSLAPENRAATNPLRLYQGVSG